MAHHRSWESMTLAGTLLSASFLRHYSSAQLTPFCFSGIGSNSRLSQAAVRPLCFLERVYFDNDVFSFFFVADAQIWSLNAATNELTRKSILLSFTSGAG
jgi:hypothetical protein